jgi:glycosyltransferase involved in cell wall biosynthesis
LNQTRPGLRIVATLHGDYGLFEEGLKGTERSFVLDWRKKLAQTISAVDRWVTISRAQHRQFEQSFGVDPKRLVAIPNGYAPPAPIRPSERTIGAPLTFVMVARGIREKGWGFLVESFGRLQGNCRLMLVGEGAYLDQLRAKHASDPQITFAGIHANPVEAIRNCDLFVHPSIYKAESLPTVIIEALFAGVPVIATDVGEVATMLSAAPGQLAGTLVSADESTLTEQLTTSMQGYIDCPDLLARHAALASAAFAKFDMGCCAAAYARLYSEVLGLPSSKSSTRVSH